MMRKLARSEPVAFWICDVNGVLIDSTAVVRAAFAATAARFRIPTIEDRMRAVSGSVLLDAYRFLDPGGDPVARAAFHMACVRERLAEIPAYADVPEILAEAIDAGVRIVAVTSHGELAEACLVRTGLYRFLDGLVTQEELTRRKPEPDLLVRAIDLLGPGRESCGQRALYVGDTPVDVYTGKKAGVHTVAATYGFSAEAEVRAACPDDVIHAFAAMRDFLPDARTINSPRLLTAGSHTAT